MACVFLSGFETGDTSEWAATSGTTSVVTTDVITGGRSGKVTSAGSASSFRSTTGFNLATAYARCRMLIHVTTNPASDQTQRILLAFLNSSVAVIASARLKVTTAGALFIHAANQVGGGGSTADYAVPADQELLLELRVTVSATVGVLELKIDGEVKETLTGLNTATNNVNALWCQVLVGSGSVDVYYDDVYVDDAGYPGAGRCLARQGAAGAPTYDAWTKTGLSTAALCWSETPFSATNNCNSGGTAAAAQTMLVSPFSATEAGKGTETIAAGDTINACRQLVVAKVSNTSSAPTFNIRRRVNGADTDVAATLTTGDVLYRGAFFTTTPTLLETAEIGAARGTSGSSRTVTVEDTWLMVDYTPAAAPAARLLSLTGVGQ